MGFFSKKPKKNRIYSLQDAMRLVSENEGYSAIEEGNGYKVIPDVEANSYISRYKDRNNIRKRLRFQPEVQSEITSSSANIDSRDNLATYIRYGYSGNERY